MELPPGDDPHVLLGVAPDADERAIKKAYAGLIKQFRPDRAPAEFARIHAAFEQLQGREAPAPAPGLPPRTEAAPDEDDPVDRLTRLVESGAYTELWNTVSAPALVAEAMVHPELAAALLPIIGALAWRFPGATLVGARFRAISLGPQHEGMHTAVENELELGYRFQLLRGRGALVPAPGDVPAPLIDLFADALIATPGRRAATFEALRPILAEPMWLLALCDRIANLDRWVGAMLVTRLQRESRYWGQRALAPLPDAVRDDLAARIRQVTAPTDPRRTVIYAGLLTLGFAVTVAGVLATHTSSGSVGAIGAAVAVERLHKQEHDRLYRDTVRPQLAALLADIGVQADCIPAWLDIQHKRRTGPLRRYVTRIRDDRGLALFGAIAALIREHARG